MVTVRALLADGASRLRRAGVESPRREADLLLGKLLGMSASALLAHDGDEVRPDAASRFERWLDRRVRGEPVAYLTGEREFWGRDFLVDERVLVPRPETEHLVEHALALPLPERATVVDVGTGCGCIAVTLALERPAWRVVALDRSAGALAVARKNARRHGVGERLALLAADLVTSLAVERVDLLVANLPYLGEADRLELGAALAHEPGVALYGGESGLELVRRLCRAAQRLRPAAFLALELGAAQAGPLLESLDRELWRASAPLPDLAGRDRNLILQRRAHAALQA